LQDYGLTIVELVVVEVPPLDANRKYLDTKRSKFGRLLAMVGGLPESKK
jgi:GTP cyclohydrolase II